MLHRFLLGALLGLAFEPALAQQAPSPAGPTLSTVRSRGALSCGISTGDPAWSQPDSRGEWQGMDADICRAIGAATLGDASRLVWQHLTGQNRFPAVVTGQVEVLTRTT